MFKDSKQLIAEPTPPESLLAVLAALAPLDQEIPLTSDSRSDPIAF